jgi:hypothetical protein
MRKKQKEPSNPRGGGRAEAHLFTVTISMPEIQENAWNRFPSPIQTNPVTLIGAPFTRGSQKSFLSREFG